jgi:superoxide dismutase, Cu-Zn family
MKTMLSTILAGMVVLGVCTLNAQVNQTKKSPAKSGAKKTVTADHDHDHDHLPLPQKAVCVLMPTKALGENVQGTFALTQMGNAVEIIGEVRGLTPGEHGFHIHEFGDLRSDDGSSAGGHFNPDNHPHAGPHDAKRHAGDLGNIKADQSGTAMIKMKVEGLKVHFVIGRALVVHAKADDLKSQPSGDAGGRVAVGVIGVASEKAAGSTTTVPAGAGAKKTKS